MANARPNLLDLMLADFDAAVPRKPLFGKPYFEFAQSTMLAMFFYSQACLIGVTFKDHPRIAEMIWGPDDLHALWRMAEHQSAVRHRSDNGDEGLRRHFLATEFPSLHGPSALEAALADMKALERIASSKINANAALRAQWVRYVAEGLAFGLTNPEQAERMLAIDFKPPDAESWKRAHDAGVAIPEKPDSYGRDEMTRDLIDNVRAFAGEFYPELVAELTL